MARAELLFTWSTCFLLQIDTDNSGEVDLEEFAKFFEFDRSFFADQARNSVLAVGQNENLMVANRRCFDCSMRMGAGK